MSASIPLDLKSTRLDALMLPLRSRDLPAVLAAAQAQWGAVSQAFDGDPLVLDVRDLPVEGDPLDWAPLLAGLRLLGLQPVALAGGERLADADQRAARVQGLQIGEALDARPTQPAAPAPTAPAPSLPTAPRCLVIERPLRSGQQVYARDADLVVLGLVSHGAEVIADGSVHVYGALRGRAIAGAKGDASARVYAQSLEAELLAIAGTFRTSEKPLPAEVAGKPAQVRLDGERLVFEPLKY